MFTKVKTEVKKVIKGVLEKVVGEGKSKRIFHSQCTKLITLTYHKLPEEFNCNEEIRNMEHEYIQNVIKARESSKSGKKRKDIIIKNMTICKEPYSDSNEKSKGLYHLHCLIETAEKMRIHNHENTAAIFIFNYCGREYYPHLSPCVDKKSYLEYITKMHNLDDKYKTDKYYATKNIERNKSIELDIREVYKNNRDYTQKDFMRILEKYTPEEIKPHHKNIDFMYYKLQKNEMSNSLLQIHIDKLDYYAKDYEGNSNYNAVEELVAHLMDKPRKYSAYIRGASSIGKTHMVYASIAELSRKEEGKCAIFKFSDFDGLKEINSIDHTRYEYIFLVMDDVSPEQEAEEGRTFLLNALAGNEDPVSLRCRNYNAYFQRNMIKIYTNNLPFKEWARNLRKEHHVRIREIVLNDDIVYYESE